MKKADEMQVYISLKSTRLAWTYCIVFLLIWMWYQYIKGQYWEILLILISSQLMVFWASQIFLKRRIVGKYEEQD